MTKACVLYVEDEDNDVVLLRTANALHTVTDGQMALDYLAGAGPFADRSEYPLPGLVLLDLKLPKKSGLEVLEWIRSHAGFKSLVMIILTSSLSVGDVRRAGELGANSFVVKPSNMKLLEDFAHRLKGWWLELDQF